jgi:hypothetical protein
MTRLKENVVLEFKGNDVLKIPTEIDRFTQKTGQLIENQIKVELPDIEFFGRYAEWRHNILINDLLKQIYEKNDSSSRK